VHGPAKRRPLRSHDVINLHRRWRCDYPACFVLTRAFISCAAGRSNRSKCPGEHIRKQRNRHTTSGYDIKIRWLGSSATPDSRRYTIPRCLGPSLPNTNSLRISSYLYRICILSYLILLSYLSLILSYLSILSTSLSIYLYHHLSTSGTPGDNRVTVRTSRTKRRRTPHAGRPVL
jgi:hypothetical protein